MLYFHRQERDLYSRKDQFGVELRERAKWDLREAMVGTETFLPKHVVIATWKNVTFAGGIPQARRIVRFPFYTVIYIISDFFPLRVYEHKCIIFLIYRQTRFKWC